MEQDKITSPFPQTPEAATKGILQEKVFLEIPQNSQEKTCAWVSFLIKLQATGNFIFHKTPLGDCFLNTEPILDFSFFHRKQSFDRGIDFKFLNKTQKWWSFATNVNLYFGIYWANVTKVLTVLWCHSPALTQYSAVIYLFKFNNGNTKAMWKTCSQLITKTPEWHQRDLFECLNCNLWTDWTRWAGISIAEVDRIPAVM